MRLHVSSSGGDLLVTWDATRCAATAANIYSGTLEDFSTFTLAVCNLPPTGSAMASAPDNVWFVVAATDGAATDGSYGRDLAGAERTYAGASLVCPVIVQHLTNNGRP